MEAKKEKIDYWDLISEKDKKEILNIPKSVFKQDTLFDFSDYFGSNVSIDNLIKKLQQIKSDYSEKYDKIELQVDDYSSATIVGNILETEEQFIKRVKIYAKSYYDNSQRILKKQESERALYKRLKKKFEK